MSAKINFKEDAAFSDSELCEEAGVFPLVNVDPERAAPNDAPRAKGKADGAAAEAGQSGTGEPAREPARDEAREPTRAPPREPPGAAPDGDKGKTGGAVAEARKKLSPWMRKRLLERRAPATAQAAGDYWSAQAEMKDTFIEGFASSFTERFGGASKNIFADLDGAAYSSDSDAAPDGETSDDDRDGDGNDAAGSAGAGGEARGSTRAAPKRGAPGARRDGGAAKRRRITSPFIGENALRSGGSERYYRGAEQQSFFHDVTPAVRGCLKCGRPGHSGTFCPVLCLRCGERGHGQKSCPHHLLVQKLCRLCGDMNHDADRLPTVSAAKSTCVVLGDSLQMPLWDEADARCLHCAAKGHHSCRMPDLMGVWQSDTSRAREKWCSNCAQKGHTAADCRAATIDEFLQRPRLVAQYLQRRGVGTLYQGRTPGYSPIRCHLCGRTGHIARDCGLQRTGKALFTSKSPKKRRQTSEDSDSDEGYLPRDIAREIKRLDAISAKSKRAKSGKKEKRKLAKASAAAAQRPSKKHKKEKKTAKRPGTATAAGASAPARPKADKAKKPSQAAKANGSDKAKAKAKAKANPKSATKVKPKTATTAQPKSAATARPTTKASAEKAKDKTKAKAKAKAKAKTKTKTKTTEKTSTKAKTGTKAKSKTNSQTKAKVKSKTKPKAKSKTKAKADAARTKGNGPTNASNAKGTQAKGGAAKPEPAAVKMKAGSPARPKAAGVQVKPGSPMVKVEKVKPGSPMVKVEKAARNKG